MDKILKPIQKCIPLLEDVTINQAAIKQFAQGIKDNDLSGSEYGIETLISGLDEEQQVAFAFVYNAINFSYWGNSKWTITIGNEKYDGSAAMIRSLKREISEDVPLCKPSFLATLNIEMAKKIFWGKPEIPLLKERVELLNILGTTICKSFNGSFSNFLTDTNYDAEKIVLKLVKTFPGIFNDTFNYKGVEVSFYKRAQLVPAHLFDLHHLGVISKQISNLDSLTAFADYKVPQLMNYFGILQYSNRLTEKLKNQIELKSGSKEELEIRIGTVWANELCTQEIKKKIPTATAVQIDGYFWFAGQKARENLLPYHRTRTIWY